MPSAGDCSSRAPKKNHRLTNQQTLVFGHRAFGELNAHKQCARQEKEKTARPDSLLKEN